MPKELTSNEYLIQGIICNRQAMEFLTYARQGVGMTGKAFLNRLINRCKANQDDAFISITDESSRKVFRAEITKGDPLQFAYIVQKIFEMKPELRDAVEKMIDQVSQGHEINVEYIENV